MHILSTVDNPACRVWRNPDPVLYVVPVTKRARMTTTELAEALGVSRQAVLKRVARGTLKPAETLANGHYLFRPVEAK